MAMMPKRVKYRKSQRGKMKGNASRSNFVAFGEYGLQGTLKLAELQRLTFCIVKARSISGYFRISL